MKDKTDVMGVVRLICNFYNNYREYLTMTHEEARHKVELMYDDLFLWIYEDELKGDKTMNVNDPSLTLDRSEEGACRNGKPLR
jgi:hypothetical protein